MSLWDAALSDNPMIAILRGIRPEQATDVADVLVDAGFRIIEVPLNSPDAFASIRLIAQRHGQSVVVGAGTVTTAGDVDKVAEAGGTIIVAPNMDPQVGAQARLRGMKWCPGVATPTEAFAALASGAAVLKFFPAELISPKAIAAVRAVLPRDTVVAAVGGITPDTMAEYHSAGVNSFGLGSALFKPGIALDEIRDRAEAFVRAYRSLAEGRNRKP
ncbi:2-dehydro-3-deoxy-6-phosphogalactonate aldolase [Roseibium sediminis]|uniref:2-dehydro-3-deoxy-6-phosphogalactonate aldolase n=1 Tax=Roseibium sediminis TaxID=1775174 RepID=UPI00123C888A|nr:2-dehydro-3-deoxy-6-phosphogalactonate aldolase [Roseibium sediminis]